MEVTLQKNQGGSTCPTMSWAIIIIKLSANQALFDIKTIARIKWKNVTTECQRLSKYHK